MTPRVLAGQSEPTSARVSSSAGPTSAAVMVAGLVYFVGSLIDLGILWLGQRQAGLQWEFVAITNTADAMPRLILALALLYLGVHLRGSGNGPMAKVLPSLMLLLGLVAVALGGLMTLNYFQLSGTVEGEAVALLRTSVIKTVSLCALYSVTLLPLSIRGIISKPSSR